MLYLLKGSRVREYHQQNVAILGAPEGEIVEIAYNRRWLEEGLTLSPNDGCVIVFADTPYQHFIPIRFGVIASVEETEARVGLTCRLGSFVRVVGEQSLSDRWVTDEASPTSPGRKLFVFEDENPGLISPQSLTEAADAWRQAVDGLRPNGFFERTTVARVTQLTDDSGVAVGPDHAVRVGSTVTASLELRSPSPHLGTVEAVLDAEPWDAVELVGPAELPSNGTGELVMRVLERGPVQVGLALRPDPLLSSRPSFSVTALDPSDGHVGTDRADGSTTAASVRSLVLRLRRDASIDHQTWIGLYQDILLPWVPADPQLLSLYAAHAFEVGDFDLCYEALARIDKRLPDDDYLFLLAALRTRRHDPIGDLIQRIDLAQEDRFTQFLDALDEVTQPTLQQLLQLLPNNLLGEDKTIRFLARAWRLVADFDVACKIAEDTAYADPDRGADLLLDRWPDAAVMPVKALNLVLDWQARPTRLAPYLGVAIERAAEEQRWDDLAGLIEKARHLLSGAERYRRLAGAGQQQMLADDPKVAAAGFALAVEATFDAAQFGHLDLAADYGAALVAHAEVKGSSQLRAAAREVKEKVDTAITESATFIVWQEMQDESAIKGLAPAYRGKVLHVVGGRPTEWHERLRTGLELSDLRWHESARDKAPNFDWAAGISSGRDVVLVITDYIGHDTSVPLRAKCTARGVPYLHGSTRLREVITALSGSRSPATAVGDER